MTDPIRRDVLAMGAGMTVAGGISLLGPQPARAGPAVAGPGPVGDGKADDTAALQRLFDTAFAGGSSRIVDLPAGTYRVTRPIRVNTRPRPDGNIVRPAGIRANGAVLLSEIGGGEPVLSIDVRATLRYVLMEGLQIRGSRQDGAGLRISCQKRGAYFYNFCLRDLIVEGCGGDGIQLVGNVFEGQLINCYARDNGHDGALMAHGAEDTVLSAVHVLGSVFGGNRRNGLSLEDGAADISCHGCYFLLNGRFGLSADHGATLLSHCGFENNHEAAESFDRGDAGLRLMVGGTLVGCTAYSIRKQRDLLRAYVTNRLVMIGCTGAGDGDAGKAGLARLDGTETGSHTAIGCHGRIDAAAGVEPLEFGGGDGGLRLGGRWDSANLLSLGDHRLWIDSDGRLRMTRGMPKGDTDGTVIGG